MIVKEKIKGKLYIKVYINMTYIELYFLIYKNESENENRKKTKNKKQWSLYFIKAFCCLACHSYLFVVGISSKENICARKLRPTHLIRTTSVALQIFLVHLSKTTLLKSKETWEGLPFNIVSGVISQDNFNFHIFIFIIMTAYGCIRFYSKW